MEPLVIEYLRQGGAADLMTDHGVRIAVSRSHPYKASLNYDQIAAKDADPLAQQCRGLVVSTRDGSPIDLAAPTLDLVVTARPMDRFFNLGQAGTTVTDEELAHPEARVYEKLDGTLCIVYFDWAALKEPGCASRDHEGWCVATRSVPDADLPVDGFGDATFRSMFKGAVRGAFGWSWPEFCVRLDRSLTYCFELTSPRAGSGVVRYDQDAPHLLAVRNTATGRELCATDVAAALEVVAAAHHPLASLAEMGALVEARPPTEAEGVVVRLPAGPGKFRRVKVKSEAYRAAHGLSGEAGSSPRNLLRIILRGMWDDVRGITRPHLQGHGDRLARGVAAWCGRVDAAYTRIAASMTSVHHADLEPKEARKRFALAVRETGLHIAPFMARWTGQTTDAAAWLQACRKGEPVSDWTDGFLDQLAEWAFAAADSEVTT